MLFFTAVALVAFYANQIYAQDYYIKNCADHSPFYSEGSVNNVFDPKSCTKFVKCSNGKGLLSEDCPEGTVFSNSSGICDTDVDCWLWKQETCPTNQFRGMQTRNFTALCCNNYFSYTANCDFPQESGTWIFKYCPDNEVFNPDIGKCRNEGVNPRWKCGLCVSGKVCEKRRTDMEYMDKCKFRTENGEIMPCAPGTMLGDSATQHCGCLVPDSNFMCLPETSCNDKLKAQELLFKGDGLNWKISSTNQNGFVANSNGILTSASDVTFFGNGHLEISALMNADFFYAEIMSMNVRFTPNYDREQKFMLISSAGECNGPRINVEVTVIPRSMLALNLTIFEGMASTVSIRGNILTQSGSVFLRVSVNSSNKDKNQYTATVTGTVNSNRPFAFEEKNVTIKNAGSGQDCSFTVGEGYTGTLSELSLLRCNNN